MSDQTNRFLKNHFPHLILTPPLFMNGLLGFGLKWQIGH